MASQHALFGRIAFQVALFVLVVLPDSFAQQQCNRQPCVSGQTAPNSGGPPCMCTVENIPPGCTVSDCQPGDKNTCSSYFCHCTETQQPECCLISPCQNVTATTPPYQPYQYPNYQYNGGYSGSPGYNDYCPYNECSCYDLPPDCKSGDRPLETGIPCSCREDGTFFPAGCVFKPCSSNNSLYCECNKDFAPSWCFQPRCIKEGGK